MRALVLAGCPSTEAPAPPPPPPPPATVQAPATATEARTALLEAAKLERLACLGPSDQDCRAFVPFSDSVQSHAAATARLIDASLDEALDPLRARVSSWVR